MPITDDYTFIVDTDSAIELTINDDITIDHFMKDRHKRKKDTKLGGELRS